MGTTNRAQSRAASTKIAFCGLTAALGVALMLSGGLIPIMTYCAPMASGVILLAVLLEFGKKTAWTTFTATAIIALLLGTDKEAAVFYLFIGYYPIVKWSFDRIKKKALRIAVKSLFFGGMISLMYIVLGFVFGMNSVIDEFSQMGIGLTGVFVLLFVLCMMIYDRLLVPLVFVYANRLRPKLKFMLR